MQDIRALLTYGRLAMTDGEAGLLNEICTLPGDHIEIGTLWGATAILAALAKPADARVYTIDIMERGYWVTGDPGTPDSDVPTARRILTNFMRAGVAHKITLMCGRSNPLPMPGIRPRTALIDGSHMERLLRTDWRNVAATTAEYVALHDYGAKYPGVQAVVERDILQDAGWELAGHVDSLIVVRRRGVSVGQSGQPLDEMYAVGVEELAGSACWV